MSIFVAILKVKIMFQNIRLIKVEQCQKLYIFQDNQNRHVISTTL